ncbi:MAG: hypothetical protein ACJ8DC_17575 [Gemmatimonadales bacterium]
MSPTSRRRVDLRQLPPRQRYAIAIAVAAVVVALAWLVGRNRPVPPWVTGYLVPALGIAYLILTAVAVIDRIRRRPRP